MTGNRTRWRCCVGALCLLRDNKNWWWWWWWWLMFNNSLKMIKTDRNVSQLWEIVCRKYNFNISTFYNIIVWITTPTVRRPTCIFWDGALLIPDTLLTLLSAQIFIGQLM
jgi:hypothetical protein